MPMTPMPSEVASGIIWPLSHKSREMLGVMPLPGSLPPQGPCLDTSA
jgi:hypothetical protein